MDAAAFTPRSPGRLVAISGGHLVFVPNDLPTDLGAGDIAIPMADAMQALGELKDACRRLANPYILVRPLQQREALTSSAMEGTFSIEDDLVSAEAGVETTQDGSTRDVVNYIHALNEAMSLLKNLPISHRVLLHVHGLLFSGLSPARGKSPGEYKSEQNWIEGGKLERARFVPPPPAEAQRCMDALERHINRDGVASWERLIDLALVHYQIETIHPFADGNGRVGRMLDGGSARPARYPNPLCQPGP